MKKLPTGEPYAGKPPVRFGGRGGSTLPDPYRASINVQRPRRKPGREKSQYLVAGGDRRLSRGIDEMLSDDAVRARYVLGEEWRDVRVRGAVGQLARDEAVSERRR